MTDEYQSIPVAVARAAVQASGQLVALEGPQYLSPDGDWLSYILPGVYESGHPDVARVIIERQGQKAREVVISWSEYAAELELDDPDWAEKRRQKPMTIFGAEVERHAYRVVFADVLAAATAKSLSPTLREGEQYVSLKLVQGEDLDAVTRDALEAYRRTYGVDPNRVEVAGGTVAAIGQKANTYIADVRITDGEPNLVRNWYADVAGAQTIKDLDALFDEADRAGAIVKDARLQAEFANRLTALTAKPAPVKPNPPRPAPQANLPRPSKRMKPRPPRDRRPERSTHLTAGLSPEDAAKLAQIKATLPEGAKGR